MSSRPYRPPVANASSTYVGTPPAGGFRPSVAPGSFAARALSIYSRPSAAVMYSDIASATARNQALIQAAIERARIQAEELRRQAEERRRLEEERYRLEKDRQQKELEIRKRRGATGDTLRLMGGTTSTASQATKETLAGNPDITNDRAQDTVRSSDPNMNIPPGATYSEDFRTSDKAFAEQRAKATGGVVTLLPTVGDSPPQYTVRPTEGVGNRGDVFRNGGRFSRTSLNKEAYQDYLEFNSRRMNQGREKQVMEEGSLNFKELSKRYEEKFFNLYYDAQVATYGNPRNITEEVPTGRYLTETDAEGNIVRRYPQMQTEIIGQDWAYATDASYIDPETGEKVDRRDYGRPVEYLGMPRGLIISNIPASPAEDADMSEWSKYYKGLQTANAIPLYQLEAPVVTLNKMDVKQRSKLQKTLLAAQLLPPDMLVVPGQMSEELIEVMAGLMSDANVAGTTWEVQLEQNLNFAAEMERRNTGASGGGGGGGGGTTTYKQIQYNQTSVAQARSLLIGVLTEALGRYPTDEEVEEFLTMLNKEEKRSPSKNITTTTSSGGNTTAISRMTPTNVDAQALAEDFARSIDGFDENATDRFMNALFESLGETRV